MIAAVIIEALCFQQFRRIGMRLSVVLLTLMNTLTAQGQNVYHTEILEAVKNTVHPFPFGVASGDPRQDGVVLWTKVLPKDLSEPVEVTWQVSIDTLLDGIVASGHVTTDSTSAFTVNVRAEGLKAGNTYYYRFTTKGQHSAIGRTRTAPENPEQLRFAVASCANLPAGYFNGYALIAQRNDIDAVIHLGDYFYEYGNRRVRITEHIPPHEIIDIKDYRSRYAQYRLDPALMEAHRLHPFIVIWDDHENANNSHRDGADNHQPDEGDWEVRKAVSKKAYFEWMPVENPEQQSIVRSFNFGELAELFMIDGRLQRDPPVQSYADSARYNKSRSMLGDEQTDWLTNGLRDSKALWRILGNNVMFSAMDFGKFAKNRRWNMDQWDGYPANRDRIFDTLEANGVRDLIVITGDIHTAWGIELSRNPHDRLTYDRRTGRGVIGAEFVAQSITSFNLDEQRGKFVARLAADFIKSPKRNPHVRHANMMDHGYMLLTITAEHAEAEWIFTRSLKERTLNTKRGQTWRIMHGGNRLVRVK